MTEQRNAILIRCCANDFQDALELYQSLAPLSAAVYFVYVGEMLPSGVPPHVARRIVLLDVDFLKRAGLYTPRLSHPELTWQCGDLALYAAYDRVQADYYWLIEPDVYASAETMARFFSAPLRATLYAPLLRREYEGWYFYEGARKYFADVRTCMFCILAIRRSVLPTLRHRRSEILASWSGTDEPAQLLPNDEAFVCSFLHAEGHACADLNRLGRLYTNRSIRFSMPASRKSLELGGGERALVHHPVCTGALFEHKFRERIATFGVSYNTAYDFLVERDVLPLAPVADQMTVAGYLLFVQPRALWRNVFWRTLDFAKRSPGLLLHHLGRVKRWALKRLPPSLVKRLPYPLGLRQPPATQEAPEKILS